MVTVRLHRVVRLALAWSLFIAIAGTGAEQRRAQLQAPPQLFGCPVFPADNIWNTPVDTLPVDPNSATWVTTVGPTKPLHPDFGPGINGIPFIGVGGTQPKVPITFQYADESEPGPYPIPPNAPIEGGPGSLGDRHVLVLDKDNCVLYEVFSAYPQPDGSWKAGSGAIFNLKSNALRPGTWTSADAAGLPILPGLVRYDEVAAGEIRHAIRLTVRETQKKYVWPARHYASPLTDPKYPPMGAWFRLKANFDVSGFLPENQVILRALKKYGMILADNGLQWFITGAPDDRWNNERLRELTRVVGSNFEAVDVSALMVNANSGQVRASVVNGSNFQPGPVAPGQIISLFGTGLGPNQGIGAQPNASGLIDTTLGETRVYFDGTAAPLLYTQANQVNLAVPYSVAGKAATQLQVEYKGTKSDAVSLAVASTAPGIFTRDSSGQGQAAAFLGDWSLISKTNPATRGSVIVLYATGEGQTEPPGIDGKLASATPPRPRAAVSLSVGGLPATVQYAGGAPGFVAGLMQINAQIPASIAPGDAVPVVLTIGSSNSQQGATVAVR